MVQTVAIIGAGSCGIPAIKSSIEAGLVTTCYEVAGQVGGLWNYEEGDCQEKGSVFRGVVTNTSRDMTAYSDFPHPESHPLYLPHNIYVKYSRMYVEHFQLQKYIKLNHKVLQVEKTKDHETSGRWKLHVENLKSKEIFEEVFDAVIISVGHHSFPLVIPIPGQDIFQGQQLHSHKYRKPEDFEKKNVVVVGFGNSGCDIAAECGTTAKQVYLSTRRNGGWILPRTLVNGLPTDAAIGIRRDTIRQSLMPFSWLCDEYEKICNAAWNHELYGLKPKHRVLNQFPVINDRLPLEVLFGKVQIKGQISRLTENGVVFKDTEEHVPTDVVIYATGFRSLFPFLNGVIDVEQKVNTIFKLVFPTELSKNTLAFVGMIDSDGRSTISLAEIQSRWIVQVFIGKTRLPSVEDMNKDNKKEEDMRLTLFGQGHRLHMYRHSTEYTDQLASFIGVKPNLWRYFFTDQKLYWALLTGPFLPTQFRLQGPHPWPGARQAVLDYEDRLQSIAKANKKQRMGDQKEKKCPWGRRVRCLLAVSLLSIFLYRRCSQPNHWCEKYLSSCLSSIKSLNKNL